MLRAFAAQVHVILQVLLIVVGVALGLWALYQLAAVVFVLILAALFAYVVEPLVHLVQCEIRITGQPRRLSRGAAVAVVYALLAGSVSLGAVLLLPRVTEQVADMISRAPTYSQSLLTWQHGWSKYYERLRMPPELRQGIDQAVLAAGKPGHRVCPGIVARRNERGVSPALADLDPDPGILFPEGREEYSSHDCHRAAAPHPIARAPTVRGDECDAGRLCPGSAPRLRRGRGAVRARLRRARDSVCRAPRRASPRSLEFIPLVGPLLLATLAAFVGALHAPALALWALAFLGILRVVEDYVIYPRLIRRGISLHPLAVIVAVLAGAGAGWCRGYVPGGSRDGRCVGRVQALARVAGGGSRHQ